MAGVAVSIYTSLYPLAESPHTPRAFFFHCRQLPIRALEVSTMQTAGNEIQALPVLQALRYPKKTIYEMAVNIFDYRKSIPEKHSLRVRLEQLARTDLEYQDVVKRLYQLDKEELFAARV